MDVGPADMAVEPTNTPRQGAIQVICLGSGGGPSEDNVTAFLVRSRASGWTKGSVLAIDAGSHLAAITRILSDELPLISRVERRPETNGNHPDDTNSQDGGLSPSCESAEILTPTIDQVQHQQPPLDPIYLERGPFAGMPLPFLSARANAAHIVRNHVSTYLITHPHLDHLAGFAINTAAFHATSRPKRLAALPFAVDAIKKHIFNDVIWPNLTDEDGGVGFVTFQRLKEGGDVMVGAGEGRGYIEVCEGLSTKGFKVSHGKCMHQPSTVSSHRGSLANVHDVVTTPGRHFGPRSYDSGHESSYLNMGDAASSHILHDSSASHHTISAGGDNGQTVDSTAFFVRDVLTAREILVFGDVEPDSLALSPRLARIWAEAAPKIVNKVLNGIFIECSYDDSHPDAVLFGHMAPRHLIDELRTLADVVWEDRAYKAEERANRKRKRVAGNGTSLSQNVPRGQDVFGLGQKRSRSFAGRASSSPFRRSSIPHHPEVFGMQPHSVEFARQTPSPTPPRVSGMTPDFAGLATSTPVNGSAKASAVDMARTVSFGSNHEAGTDSPGGTEPPLQGVRVIIIHVKDTLTDGPHVSERILAQLERHAERLKRDGRALGCTFEISESGRDYWF